MCRHEGILSSAPLSICAAALSLLLLLAEEEFGWPARLPRYEDPPDENHKKAFFPLVRVVRGPSETKTVGVERAALLSLVARLPRSPEQHRRR